MNIPEILKDKIFTVSEFNDFVNGILQPMQVWIEGEVSDWRVSQNKFIWFSLKDEEQTVSCFAMVFRIRQPIEEGMKVRVFGYPKIYGKSGRFSFIVEKLELSGEGSLKRAFNLLRAKLEKEGLFAPERKRALPPYPQTIGLITSRGAAAYSDFLKHVNARMGGLEITFAPVAVQGEKAISEIVGAFDFFNHKPPDVVVLIRGGGSLEDLKEFNSEEIARAVFSSKAPVVAGIGHERDISLAELAADQRASTPTHAAQLAVPDRGELANYLAALLNSQKETVVNQLFSQQRRLQTNTGSLQDAILTNVYGIKSLLQKFTFEFRRVADNIHIQKNRLKADKQLLGSLAPNAVLARGYSIVRKNGKIIKDVGEVSVGDKLAVTLAKGGLESEVRRIISNS